MSIGKIEFKNMNFQFEDSDKVFSDINFEFPEDRVIKLSSLLPGKSTLLKILAGILPVTSGSYFINGRDVAEMSFEEFLPLRLKLGYTFDYGGLLNNKTLLENALLPLQYHRQFNEESEVWVQKLMQRFKLEKSQHLRPYSVPGAHRKAACVLRAFVNNPQFLLLDEPDAGLKDDGVLALCQTIEECFEKGNLKKVIYVSDHPLLDKRLGPTEVYVGGIQIGENGMAA